MSETRFVYLARGGGLRAMGPYETDRDAWQALRDADGLPVAGAAVWPVTQREARKILGERHD